MARTNLWTCDGCGASEKTENELPIGWGAVSVKIEGFRDGRYSVPNISESHHLCNPCQRKLKEYAQPKNWPRAADAATIGEVIHGN